MILVQIEQSLQSLYHLESTFSVINFVRVSSEARSPEQLLVRQTGDEVELALVFRPEVLESLQVYNPFLKLAEENLNPFFIAVEGVSHFLYLVQKVGETQPVSYLEMELQAEIDKFLVVCLLCHHHRQEVPLQLISVLFEDFSLHSAMAPCMQGRYHEASRMARHFCLHLHRQYARRLAWRPLYEAARQFYHLNHWGKLRFLGL